MTDADLSTRFDQLREYVDLAVPMPGPVSPVAVGQDDRPPACRRPVIEGKAEHRNASEHVASVRASNATELLTREHDRSSASSAAKRTRRAVLVAASVLAVAGVVVVATVAGTQRSPSHRAAAATPAYAYIDESSGCTPNALGSPQRIWYTSDGAHAIPNPSGGAPTVLPLSLGTSRLSGPQISNLPTDPAQLTQALSQLVHSDQDGTRQLAADGQVFNMLEALVTLPVNPSLRLAALSAGSSLAGVTTTPNATDQFQNTGTSLSWSEGKGQTLQILISPSSGLAESSKDVVSVGEGAPALVCTTRITSSGTASTITGG